MQEAAEGAEEGEEDSETLSLHCEAGLCQTTPQSLSSTPYEHAPHQSSDWEVFSHVCWRAAPFQKSGCSRRTLLTLRKVLRRAHECLLPKSARQSLSRLMYHDYTQTGLTSYPCSRVEGAQTAKLCLREPLLSRASVLINTTGLPSEYQMSNSGCFAITECLADEFNI